MTDKTSGWGALIGLILMAIIMIILLPTIAVLIGWLTGLILEMTLGDNLTNWINLTLGTDRFSRGDLPKVTAVLALVSMFFTRYRSGGDSN